MSYPPDPASVWALATGCFAFVNGVAKSRQLKEIRDDVKDTREDVKAVQGCVSEMKKQLEAIEKHLKDHTKH